MSAWTERRLLVVNARDVLTRGVIVLATAACTTGATRAVRAQDTTVVAPPPAVTATAARRPSVFELLNLDRLQLTSLGASVGSVRPANVDPTRLYSLQADYGEIADRVRIVFIASYWGSRYNGRSVRDYEDALRAVVGDPAGDDSIDVGVVRVQDLSLGVDVRWLKWGSGFIRPFVGGGLGAHAVNAEGRAVTGTFVESALDNIAASVAAFAGIDAALLPNLTLEMQARYDLFSGVRHASVRAGASYVFNAMRGPAPRGGRDR